MRFKIQLVMESDDQGPVVTELLNIERDEMSPGNLGLHLSEARDLLSTAKLRWSKSKSTRSLPPRANA